MLATIDKLSYRNLALFALALGLAPFFPEPHLVEKVTLLMNGALSRPIDIFDLFLHSFPLVLLGIKFVRDYLRKPRG
ncbi:RND transporter [bacterium]|nr:RND transporter [bacterium]